MLILPFEPSIPRYRFGTSIDQIPYLFDVRWNSRDAAWYFDVREIDETIIRVGIKIVLGCYLGRTVNHTIFRDGVIVAYDTTRQGKPPGLDDLGTRVLIQRFDLQEVIYATVPAPLGPPGNG